MAGTWYLNEANTEEEGMFAMVGQRRISRERLAEIWRAIEGISLDTDREVSIEEAEAFVEGDTFGEFLDRNGATVQMYEEDYE